MGDLVIELYGTRISTLAGTWRDFDFVCAPGAIEAFGIDSLMLSVTIPMTVVPTRARKGRRQAHRWDTVGDLR